MPVELLLFTYVVGLVPVLYGLYIIVVGRVRLSARDPEPIRGVRARLLGVYSVMIACGYYVVITLAWSVFDR